MRRGKITGSTVGRGAHVLPAKHETFRAQPIPDPVLAPTTPTIIHVLQAGLPLCGFSPGPPVTWPPRHLWVSIADDLRHSRITCPGCETALATLKDKRRTAHKGATT